MTLHYDRMGTKCSGGAQPGTTALHRAVEERWSFLTPAGIYNCRPVRGGASLSAHGEGRADDEGTPKPSDPRGWPVAHELVAKADELGIQCVIWDRMIWSVLTPAWHRYGGQDPHTGHLHLEQNWDGARHLTLTQALRVLAAGPSTPGGFLMALTDEEQRNIANAIGRMDARIEEAWGAVARAEAIEFPEIDGALAEIRAKLAQTPTPGDPKAFAQAVADAFGEEAVERLAKAFAKQLGQKLVEQ